MRRHGYGFRTLLMLADGPFAVALLAIASFLSFGSDSPVLPREVGGYDLWHRRRLWMKPGSTWFLWLDVKILARIVPAALEGR